MLKFLEVYIFATTSEGIHSWYPTLPYPTTLPYPYITLPYPTLPYPTLPLPYLTLPYHHAIPTPTHTLLPFPYPYATPTLPEPIPTLPYPTLPTPPHPTPPRQFRLYRFKVCQLLLHYTFLATRGQKCVENYSYEPNGGQIVVT